MILPRMGSIGRLAIICSWLVAGSDDGMADSTSSMTVDPVPERYVARVPDDASLTKLPLFPGRTQFSRPMVPSRYMIAYGYSAPGEKFGTFGVIDFRRGEIVKRFDDPVERAIDVIAVSPDGRLAAVAAKRTKNARERGVNAMEVWDLVDEKMLTSRQSVMFRSTNNAQIVLVFLDDQRLLMCDGSQPKQVYSVLNARSGQQLARFGDGKIVPRNELGISPGGRYVAIGTNQDFKVWDTTNAENVFATTFSQARKYGSYIPSFMGTGFSEDGTSMLAFLSYGHVVEIHRWTIPGLTHSLTSVDLRPTRPTAGLYSNALQQIPGTDLWVYYNLPVLKPGIPAPLATLDPKNQDTIHGFQWVVNSRMIARRTIATEQRNGTFYRLMPIPVPQAQIRQQLRRHSGAP